MRACIILYVKSPHCRYASKSTESKSMILSFIVNEWSIPAEQLVCEIAFYCHCSVFSIPDDLLPCYPRQIVLKNTISNYADIKPSGL